jgi:glucose/arabinose dehydrogenase
VKNRRKLLRVLLILFFSCVLGAAAIYIYFGRQVNFRGSLGSGRLGDVIVPPGFTVSVYAEGLQGPRFLAFGPEGVLYVADRGNNRIVALPDNDEDGLADAIREFATDLNSPHSLVFHQDAWYVGVPNGVVRLQDVDGDGRADLQTPIIDDIPTSGVHRTRTVEFLPDGRLVLSVGSSCNVCEEDDPRRAAVVVYDGPEGGGETLYASGLRNAVGLAIHPETGELWATNNGRDLMGDDVPPDTIHVLRQGSDGGWPYCHSGRIVDPNLGFEDACQAMEAPVVELQAHSAPLGLVFYPATGNNGPGSFPQEYWGDLFVAFHGSWNRSIPTGYKVVRVPLNGSQPGGPVEDFAVGWLDESSGQASGRPVGLAVGPDGALYVSDDKGGFIYRIYYQGGG